MVAIIGGEPKRFRPLIDLYREAGRRAGHSPERLTVGLHSVGFLEDTTDEAAEIFFPGYAHRFTRAADRRRKNGGEKNPVCERSSWRHLAHQVPNGCVDAPRTKSSESLLYAPDGSDPSH